MVGVKGGITGDKNPMLNKSVSTIIRWYKGHTKFEIHKNTTNFKWQRRFHDHIIRNEQAYRKISEYIKNNPISWQSDIYCEINTGYSVNQSEPETN